MAWQQHRVELLVDAVFALDGTVRSNDWRRQAHPPYVAGSAQHGFFVAYFVRHAFRGDGFAVVLDTQYPN
jgi:hypothetical protein